MDCLEKAAMATGNEKGFMHADYAQSLYIYAMVSLNFGDADRTIPALKKCLEIRLEVLGRLNSSTAITVGSLGTALLMFRKLEEAETAIRESISIAEEMLGRVHVNTAYAYGALSRCLELQPRLDEATKAQETALRIHEEVALDEAQKIARCINQTASIEDVRTKNVNVLKAARALATLFEATGKDPAEVYKPFGGAQAFEKHLLYATEEEKGPEQVPAQHIM